jgi:MYND finger
MDLLASLNVDDLPEQQTRMLHLAEANPDFQLNLGFDACANCGQSLIDGESGGAAVAVVCRACQRVQYCSEACRHQDSTVPLLSSSDDEVMEPETALGHTSVVCALLNLCNDDEQVEAANTEGSCTNRGGATRTLDPVRMEAATSRVRSEYESYPATLANVLSDGPCFQEVLGRSGRDSNRLTIYILGASEDAELSQGPTVSHSSRAAVCSDYAEALAELADQYQLPTIQLYFIGPDCPLEPFHESAPLQYLEKQIGTLSMRSVKGVCNADTMDNLEPVDIVVLFNPGLTCPDYPDWKETLRTIPNGTPFLLTTNTEMEGMADCQFLLDQDKIQSLPAGLADVFDVSSENDHTSTAFFAVNPFAGSRVRQNGTMANDLFVKNRWMLGGVLASFDPSASAKLSLGSSPSKRSKSEVGCSAANSKSSNPALI